MSPLCSNSFLANKFQKIIMISLKANSQKLLEGTSSEIFVFSYFIFQDSMYLNMFYHLKFFGMSAMYYPCALYIRRIFKS